MGVKPNMDWFVSQDYGCNKPTECGNLGMCICDVNFLAGYVSAHVWNAWYPLWPNQNRFIASGPGTGITTNLRDWDDFGLELIPEEYPEYFEVTFKVTGIGLAELCTGSTMPCAECDHCVDPDCTNIVCVERQATIGCACCAGCEKYPCIGGECTGGGVIINNCDCTTICNNCDGCRDCRTVAPTTSKSCSCDADDCEACDCHVLGKILGDGTGSIVIGDAVQILMHLAKMPTSVLSSGNSTPARLKAATITVNSIENDRIQIGDAVQVLMYLAKMSASLVDGVNIDGRHAPNVRASR